MQRTPVQSSNVQSIGYENGVLEIQFHNGGIYQYFDVPAQIHQALMAASSKGKFFAQNIRGAYRYARV
jgi:uncharacterized protein